MKIVKKNRKFKKVSFLIGTGISTSAGIPDFRSEGGLYEKIRTKYKGSIIKHPTDLFDINFFRENPKFYYEYNKEESLKKHLPTKTHVTIFIL